jgi:sugar lactone lactonase YvrE
MKIMKISFTLLWTLTWVLALASPARAELLFYAASNDMISGNSAILKVDSDGSSSVWNINWDEGIELYDPRGIAVDFSGNVYLNDSQYIYKIDPSGHGTIFATKPHDYYSYGVTVDAAGNVYSVGAVGSFYGIYKYNAGGELLATWSYSYGPSFSNLVIGPDGALYSGDVFAGLVYRIDPTTGVFDNFASVYTPGDVAFGPDGVLYVGSYKSVYAVDDGVVTEILRSRVYSAYGLGVDADGNVYIGNNRSNWDNEILRHAPGTSDTSYTIFSDLTEEQTITGIAMVPEPSTWMLVLLGGGLAVAGFRFRRIHGDRLRDAGFIAAA